MNGSLNVYILTYNRDIYLKTAVESVLNQTYSKFNLYILDNNSTDNTEQIISEFHDERIHYIRHEKNIGGLNNIQYAFDHCTADYCVLFHDDDVMLPEMLEREKEILDCNSKIVLVAGNGFVIDEYGNEKRVFFHKKSKQPVYMQGELFHKYMSAGYTLLFPSIMYRTCFFKEKDIRFRTNAGPCADVIFYFEAEMAGGWIYELEDRIMKYRVHERQDSVASRHTMHIQLYHYMRKEPSFNSMLYMYKKEQKCKFKQHAFYIWADLFHSSLSLEEAEEELRKYSDVLLYRKLDYWKYRKLYLFTQKHKKMLYRINKIRKRIRLFIKIFDAKYP